MSVAPPTTFSSAGAGSPGRQFEFADVVRIARDRFSVIRNITLAVVALTLLVLFLLPSLYSTSAVVMLDPRKNTVTGLSAVLSDMPTDPASVQNQIQILTSRDLAGEVIQRLGLANDPEFNVALAPFSLNPMHWIDFDSSGQPGYEERKYARIVDEFTKHLDVESLGLSTAMSVKFSSRDPQKAARIANAVADAYIETQIAAKSEATQRTTAWLTQRIRELAQQLQIAEANIQRYKAENAINDTGEGTLSLVDQQLAGLNTQLVQARADLAAKQANDQRIKALVQTGDAADVSQVVASPLIVQLRTQQADALRDEAQLAARYGPRHPKRLAAESQLRDLQTKIDQEVTRIGGSVANDVAVARAQTNSLQASLDQLESRSNDQNFARVKLKSLEANADSTRTMYESFVTRLRETQGQDAIQMGDSRVISHATVPTLPSSPPRLLLCLASVPGGLLLGLLCALLMERMGQTAPQRQLAVMRQTVPVLAHVPDALFPRAADLLKDQPFSPFAQALRALARRLVSSANGGPRVIVVTSSDAREGQTNVAVGLARALAELRQRVVVVDGNLQSPMVGRTMGLENATSGMLDVLRGTAPLSGSLAKDTKSNAFLLTSTQRIADPSAAWASPAMAALILHLRQSCGVVIIDAPQVWAKEMPFIACQADALILVAKAAEQPRIDVATKALSAMRRAPIGLVLTA